MTCDPTTMDVASVAQRDGVLISWRLDKQLQRDFPVTTWQPLHEQAGPWYAAGCCGVSWGDLRSCAWFRQHLQQFMALSRLFLASVWLPPYTCEFAAD